MPRYTITESVGSRVENVDTFRDLEKHHPSAGREPGRDYATIDGELEEIRRTNDGRVLIKKDFILSRGDGGPVDIPAPVAGYIHYPNIPGDTTNAVRIYDRPFGEPGARLLAQSLHMERGTSPPQGSRIEYGQPMGRMGDTGSPGSIHAHVEAEHAQFTRYIADIDAGRIAPGVWPARGNAPAPGAPGGGAGSGSGAMADGVLREGEQGPEVRSLQQRLNQLGMRDARGQALGVDGDFGDRTREAVERFQRSRGIAVDGVVGRDTFRELGEAAREQGGTPRPGAPSAPPTGQGDVGAAIAANARGWVGRDFKPGQTERCQDFVNSVLHQTRPGLDDRIGTTRSAVDGLGSGELLASRFAGADVSRQIPLSQARPGDIITFDNTYGSYPRGTITHVGIYVGDGMMVDRPTASRPVQMRSIDTFGEGNYRIFRPHAYAQEQALGGRDATPESPQRSVIGGREAPLLTAADHPDRALMQQARAGIERLPPGSVANERERDQLAAALVLEAKVGGLTRIDSVVPNASGSGLFVVQGRLDDPTHQRVLADRTQLAAQTVEQSSQRLQQVAQVAAAPVAEDASERERRAVAARGVA